MPIFFTDLRRGSSTRINALASDEPIGPELIKTVRAFIVTEVHHMQTKLLDENEGRRTFAVILETGEEIATRLQTFAEREQLTAAQITAIGALSDAELNFFDWESKRYLPNDVREQVEVASLNGDVAIGPGGKPTIHMHAVLGRRDGSALAGHLTRGHVRPTLEIIVTESPAHLCKKHDPETGLALIRGEERR
jgi:uncharacterized protein